MQRMTTVCLTLLIATFTVTILDPPLAWGQSLEDETIQSAANVLTETMASPMNSIPKSMLENAYGVAIIPKVIKGSFVIGARHGRGILCVRDPNGLWHAPVFITLTGGNVGWQIGLQSSDVILVFKTQKSVEGLLSGKLTLGADAAAAAGPIGRQGAIATDGKLQAEVYTYSRSRGLFAGVSIDGSVISVDQLATGAYYRSPGPGQPVVVPPAAEQLTQSIATITDPSNSPTQSVQQSSITQRFAIPEAEVLRSQLSQLAPELFEILSPEWQAYLAIPSNIFSGGVPTDLASLQTVLAHYDKIATDPQFRDLAARPEFQSVYGLLRHYADSLSPTTATLQLPPPPAASSQILPR